MSHHQDQCTPVPITVASLWGTAGLHGASFLRNCHGINLWAIVCTGLAFLPISRVTALGSFLPSTFPPVTIPRHLRCGIQIKYWYMYFCLYESCGFLALWFWHNDQWMIRTAGKPGKIMDFLLLKIILVIAFLPGAKGGVTSLSSLCWVQVSLSALKGQCSLSMCPSNSSVRAK